MPYPSTSDETVVQSRREDMPDGPRHGPEAPKGRSNIEIIDLSTLQEQDVCTSVSHWPLQGSKSIGRYHFLVYTCFPMMCTENSNHRGACGARRRRALCANHWKMCIHPKNIYTNGFVGLEGPMTGAGVYILVPKTSRYERQRLTLSKWAHIHRIMMKQDAVGTGRHVWWPLCPVARKGKT
jgi:hypothetical protein